MKKFKSISCAFTVKRFVAVIITTVLFASAAIYTSAKSNLLAPDEVFMAGSTAGCFGAACAPGATATFSGLTYSNSTFSGTTANGFRGLGGSPNPGSNLNNLGSFTLSTTLSTYNSTFTLQVTFTAPQGITGSNQATFTSTVTGTVISNNVGGVFLDFNNTPIVFSFNDPTCEPDPTGGIPGQQTTCGIGSFSFSVNDLAIDPGQTASLTGQITGAQQSIVTAAIVSLKGRVQTHKGQGIENAVIEISGGDLPEPVRYRTDQSGFYLFSGLTAGQTYVVSVNAKRYEFAEPVRVVTVLEELSGFNFVSNNSSRRKAQ